MKEKKILKMQSLAILIVMVLQIVLPIFPLSTISKAATTGSGTQADPWDISAEGSENNVTAYIDGTTLYIQGTGEMKDFYSIWTPWHEDSNSNNITEVIIAQGVTNIGECAIFEMSNVQSISIPEGVTSIEFDAFGCCQNLKNIDLPDGLLLIGEYAFEHSGLENITIPANVTNIYNNPFVGCDNLEYIEVDSNNQNYVAEDGVLFTSDMKKIISYPAGNNRTSYTIPQGVTDLGYGMFDSCKKLMEVIIPNTIEKIDETLYNHNEFNFSPSSMDVYYYPDCTAMAEYVANHPDEANFIEIVEGTKPDPWDISATGTENNVSAYISHNTLYITGTGNMRDITAGEAPWESVKDTFNKIVIEEGVNNLGMTAFYGCINVTYVEISSTVTQISDSAFAGCNKLEKIKVSSQNANYSSSEGVLFNKNKTVLVRYPQGKEDIRYYIPTTVLCLKNTAFESCRNLRIIVTPDNIEQVGVYSFATHRSGKTTVYYDGNNTIMSTYANSNSNEAIFKEKTLDSIIVSATGMTKSQFDVGETFEENDLIGLQVTIKYKDTSIQDKVITDNFVENGILFYPEIGTTFTKEDYHNHLSVYFEELSYKFAMPILGGNGTQENPWDISDTENDKVSAYIEEIENNGRKLHITGEGNMRILTTSPWSSSSIANTITEVVIHEGVTNIGMSAFAYCQNLSKVTIADTVTKINDSVFIFCTSLESITIPKNVNEIGINVFSFCSNLKEIKVDSQNQTFRDLIGSLYSKDLKTLICVPEGKEIIRFEVKSDVKNISTGAFGACKKIEKIILPSTITSVGPSAFATQRTGKTEVYYDSGNTAVEDYIANYPTDAEFKVKTLKSMTLDRSEMTVTQFNVGETFEESDLAGLKITIEYKDTSIPNKVITENFEENGIRFDPLIGTTFENENLNKGVNVYYEELYKHMNMPVLGATGTQEDPWDISYTENDDVHAYIEQAQNNKKILHITGTGNMKRLTIAPWENVKETIAEIVIHEGVTNISLNAFHECTNVTNITIPNTVTSIANNAFLSCSSLTSITIPASVISIESAIAFALCENLEEINVDNRNQKYSDINGVLFSKDQRTLVCFPEGKEVTKYVIPSNVKEIKDSAFGLCEKVEKIVVPDDIETMGICVFTRTSEIKAKVYYNHNNTVMKDYKTQNPNEAIYKEINLDSIVADTTGMIKTQFEVGETFELNDLEGIKITINYDDETESQVITDYTQLTEENGFIFNPALNSTFNAVDANNKVTISYDDGIIRSTIIDMPVVEQTPVTLTRIELNVENVKKDYTVGETLDLTGLVVTAVYSDNSTQIVTDYTTTPSVGTPLTLQNNKVTVSYQGKTAEYNINVTETIIVNTIESIAINTTNVKKIYNVGETLDLNGLVVNKIYSDGTEVIVDSGFTSENGFTITPSHGTQLTEPSNSRRVTVSYRENGKTVSAYFTIKIIGVKSISVDTSNMKTVYDIGEALSLRGLVVTATYTDNTTENVTDYESNPKNGTVLTTPGEQTVTIAFGGKTASFTVTVNEPATTPTVTSITIKSYPNKRTYNVGETLDLTGLVITVHYSDNTTQDITRGYTSNPANGTEFTTSGRKTITITYEGKTATFTVTVNESQEESILREESTYEEDGTYIKNVLLKTGIREFLSNFNSSYVIELSDENAEYVGTGMEVTVKKLQNSVLNVITVLEVVIKGDITGDGIANISDIFEINKVRLHTSTLEGAKAIAADMNNDTEINFLDILQVNNLRINVD